MKIRYLGTAAAEGSPALFCTCASCMQARATGGKDIRSRSETLLNDDLIIDYSADAYWHGLRFNVPYYNIHDYLITHAHSDHFYPMDFENVDRPFAKNPEDWPLFTLHGSADLEEELIRVVEKHPEHLVFRAMEAYETYDVGRYKVTPLHARHGTKNPFNYVIQDGEKTLLYLHDGGAPFEETYECFRKNGFKFDIISYDFTEGLQEKLDYDGHMCMGQNKELRAYLEEQGFLNEGCIHIANHFSHGGLCTNWVECHELYEKDGFMMTYDGFEIEV